MGQNQTMNFFNENTRLDMSSQNNMMKGLAMISTQCHPLSHQEFIPKFVYLYVCYYCEEEFPSKAALQTHHSVCSLIPTVGQLRTHSVSETADVPEAAPAPSQPSDTSIASRVKNTPSKASNLTKRPQALDLTPGHSTKKLQTPVKTPGTPSLYSPLSKIHKTKYLSALGILPLQKARRVSERRRSTYCESIDLEEDTLPSPAKPRTPKLLISHLSRDENSSNGSAENSGTCMRSLFSSQSSKVGDKEQDPEMDTVKENSGTKGNNPEQTSQDKLRNFKSLFNIPISSLLGQCVIKHFKGDPSLHILSDIESHCITELPKNREQRCRLRVRHPTYPVTFRGYVKNKERPYFHKYNFTCDDKKESLKRSKTGLDRKSRVLLKKMRECNVLLSRLTKADIKRWMPTENQLTVDLKALTPSEIGYWVSPKPAPVPNQPATFPSGLSLFSPNLNKVLGLRTQADKYQGLSSIHTHLSVANFVSEDVSAEVTRNRGTVLRSILSDFIEKGEIKGGILPESNPPSSAGYATLRQLLQKRGAYTGTEAHKLPDITNLDPATQLSKSLRVNRSQLASNIKADGGSAVKRNAQEKVIVQSSPTSRLSRKDRKSGEGVPVSCASQLTTSKSTWVRVAEEGEKISSSDETVPLEDPATIPLASLALTNDLAFISSSSSVKSDSLSSNASSTSSNENSNVRKLRERPRKVRDSPQLFTGALDTSSLSKTVANKVAETISGTASNLPPVPSVPSSHKQINGLSQLGTTSPASCLVSHSTHQKKSRKGNSAVSDSRLKKRLSRAGLVWRASLPLDTERDQENESSPKVLIKLGKVESNAPEKGTCAGGLTSGSRRRRNRTVSKKRPTG